MSFCDIITKGKGHRRVTQAGVSEKAQICVTSYTDRV